MKQYVTHFKNDKLEVEPFKYFYFKDQLEWAHKILDSFFYGENYKFEISSYYASEINSKIEIPEKVKLLELILFLYLQESEFLLINTCKMSKDYDPSDRLAIDITLTLLKKPREIFDEVLLELQKQSKKVRKKEFTSQEKEILNLISEKRENEELFITIDEIIKCCKPVVKGVTEEEKYRRKRKRSENIISDLRKKIDLPLDEHSIDRDFDGYKIK